MVRRSDFHSGRKVKDNTVVMSRSRSPPSRFHSFTDLNSEVRFRLRESLRTVLISELRSESSGTFVGQLTDEFRVLDGQFDGLFLGVPEHDLTEIWASGIVHVQDRFLAPGHGFNGPPD
jgi:hypothetical protein